MYSGTGWYEIVSNPDKLAHYYRQQAAFFLMTQREKEGRWRSAEDDWLNGEWQLTSGKFRELERIVIYQVQQAYCSDSVHVSAWSDLPNSDAQRDLLVVGLAKPLNTLSSLSESVCSAAVKASKTVHGLLEFLTHEIRCTESN